MVNDLSNASKTGDVPAWDDFLACLPPNWRDIVSASNVLKGQRKDKEPETLMHVLMLHLFCGYSLRETSAVSTVAGIASLSDVALLKRLRKSKPMFQALCSEMFGAVSHNDDFAGFNIRLIDGTILKEPGQFGTQWRMHYSFSVPGMFCDAFELTQAKGKGTGEGLEKFLVKPNDVFVADRGFCKFGCFDHVAKGGGYSCIRWNSGSLPLYNEDGSSFDINRFLKSMPLEGRCAEANVYIKGNTPEERLSCRVCAIKKSETAAAQARKELRQYSSRRGTTPTALTLMLCDFIIIITTLPDDVFSLKAILELYRIRWQVELVFKRFKSVLKIGAIPKYTDESTEAWIYGKMFIALLIERFSSRLGAFSPWRTVVYSRDTKKFMERIQSIISYSKSLDHTSDKTR